MDEVVRVGRVSSILPEDGHIRVTYPEMDASVTKEIPVFFMHGEYRMPPVGSQVLVLHLSDGQDAGVALGGYWSDEDIPEETGADLYRKDMVSGYLADRGGAVELHGDSITLSDATGSITVSELIKAVKGG